MEDVKDDIHKKNANKVEGCVEVEVNSNGEDNIKETTTNSHSNLLSIAQNIEILDHFQAKEGGCNNNNTLRWVQKNMNCPNFQLVQLNITIEN